MVLIFVGVAVGVGLYSPPHHHERRRFRSGRGRNVGLWMSAFAYGTSYFSAVVFVGYAGQFGWKYGIAAVWAGIGTILGSLWPAGVFRSAHAGDDASPGRHHHARSSSASVSVEGSHRQRGHYLRVPDPVHCKRVQRPVASVRHGVRPPLRGMRHRHGRHHVPVRGPGRLHGNRHERLSREVGIVMLFGIVAVIAAVILNNAGGFSEAITLSQQIPAEGSQMAGPFVSSVRPRPVQPARRCEKRPAWRTWVTQMVQKFYAIKSGPAVKQGAIISTLFAFVAAGGSYFLGGFGRLYADKIEIGPPASPVRPSSRPCCQPCLTSSSVSSSCSCCPPACPRCPRWFLTSSSTPTPRSSAGQRGEEDERL